MLPRLLQWISIQVQKKAFQATIRKPLASGYFKSVQSVAFVEKNGLYRGGREGWIRQIGKMYFTKAAVIVLD